MISGVCPLLVEADIAARRQARALKSAFSAKPPAISQAGPAQRRIVEHHSFSAVSTSWTHNTVPSIFKYSPHKLIRGELSLATHE
jgi:hypothetical protein